jgi:tetratricopeptide (TPR) repeat protein/tRNA A-37 threonylcarbamoyl transferase component Bud32/TolB-like protein
MSASYDPFYYDRRFDPFPGIIPMVSMSGQRDDDDPPSTPSAALAETLVTPDRMTSPVENAPPPPGARTFQPDEFVARRYRVIRFIARGGMGEVYEVEDLELKARIALKTLRGELADDEVLLERFRREINLSRKVTHANVCRIFDLGFHASPRGRITFLTMELLDGESLHRRIRRTGRMQSEEALPIVEQMAAGLAAAHAYGVVHRDFKSDNVMLVSAASSTGPRVVVTDFGLARSQDASALTTGSGGRLKGTPAYMAPEQVTGGHIGPPADVYALGVVMYEMMTGALPFGGDNAMEVALRRLTARPPSPRRVVPGLDARWERVILRCLEREPDRRFSSVNEVVAALRGPTPAPVLPKLPLLATGALAALLVAGGAALFWTRSHPAAPVAPAARSKRAVAVLGLRNLSDKPETAWLGTALAELLSSEVSAGGELRRVPAESVGRLRRELQLPDGGQLSPEQLALVRATVDADYVLAGSYLALPGADGKLRLEVQLQDTRTGETIAADSETGGQAGLFELVSQAGQHLRGRLGVSALGPADEAQARTSLPSDSAAARPYAEGLHRLRLFDALGARPLLEEATRADPSFPLAHAALSEAFRRLGRQADEEREAKLAYDHAQGLPREQQLLVEANWRVSRREWTRAVELYRSLYDFFPATIDYGLSLTHAQLQAGRAKEALDTVAKLRASSENATRDPRVEVAEAEACGAVSDYPRQDAAAKRAVDKARALGAQELEGDALLNESIAANMIGDRKRALERADQAYVLFLKIGNPYSVGQALLKRANAAWRTGDLPGARGRFQEAENLFRKLGDENAVARAIHGYANIESDMHHSPNALKLYREALPMYERAGNLVGVEAMHMNIGQQLQRNRDLDGAEREMKAGRDLAQQTGERHAEAIANESLGGLYLDRGEPEKALERTRAATALAESIKDATTVAQTRRKQGEELWAMGRAKEAEKAFLDGIAMLDKMNEIGRSGDGKLRLARMYLETGRVPEAEKMARAAAEQVKKAGDDSGEAGAALADALVAAGKLGEARSVAEQALQQEPENLQVQIAMAAVELAEKHPDRAISRLEKAMAARLPEVPDRFDAELLLGKALVAIGSTGEAKTRMKALAAEAKEKGFGGVADRATAAAR